MPVVHHLKSYAIVKERKVALLRRPAIPTSPVIGGGERDRTDGLLLARQALSQLSYTPVKSGGPGRT